MSCVGSPVGPLTEQMTGGPDRALVRIRRAPCRASPGIAHYFSMLHDEDGSGKSFGLRVWAIKATYVVSETISFGVNHDCEEAT